jgi:hypothetical protein
MGAIDWQVCQKMGDLLFVINAWSDHAKEAAFRRRFARFGEKVVVRRDTSVVCWLADPQPHERVMRHGACALIYLDTAGLTACKIAVRSVAAWPYLAPEGVFIWRDYLDRRQQTVREAVDHVLADRPHRVSFQNGYLGVIGNG